MNEQLIKDRLKELELTIMMPRHCYLYRPNTERYHVYCMSKHPWREILATGSLEIARNATLLANNSVGTNQFLDLKFEHEMLTDQLAALNPKKESSNGRQDTRSSKRVNS